VIETWRRCALPRAALATLSADAAARRLVFAYPPEIMTSTAPHPTMDLLLADAIDLRPLLERGLPEDAAGDASLSTTRSPC
jgi:hypothetical protein